MFNKYFIGGNTNNQKCEVNLNQPSTGFIQKSNPVSRFIRFQRGSKIEEQLFPTDPRNKPHLTYVENKFDVDHCEISGYYDVTKEEEVIVLQVCIFGQDYMLAEYVFVKDIE